MPSQSQSPWRGIVFYFDKADPRLCVPKRTRLGWTLNLAHGASWGGSSPR